MIHICLKLLPGRDDTLRKQMAQALLETTRKIAKDENITISVETTELHEPSYIK